MDPGGRDFLANCGRASEAILEEMDPEERQDVEDLLEFSGTWRGEMTTDYIHWPGCAGKEGIAALRNFEATW